jgi:hypothetical protein
VLSIGVFFSLMIIGLTAALPKAMTSGLTAQGVSSTLAGQIAHAPAVATLFAAFLGYNPMAQLLHSAAAAGVSSAQWAVITGKTFFPHLISDPFMHGLRIAFSASVVMCIIAAWTSWMRGGKYVHGDDDTKAFGAPSDPDADGDRAPKTEEWVPA